MSSDITYVKVIYNKEMRILINKLKHYGMSNEGIIFGGLVRSDIIGTHYRKEFFKKTSDYTRYWDDDYDRDTTMRRIYPNDMDIYFKKEDNVNNFITSVGNLTKSFNGSYDVIKNYRNRALKYIFDNDKLSHTKVFIDIRIGNTLSFSGIKLKFSIDIIYNKNYSVFDDFRCYEPPFFNLDFLCNIFLMEYNNNNTIIRISNCSGTPIDNMNFIDKSRMSSKIMNDIIENKTVFVRCQPSLNEESINCYRIIKMIENDWNITNLPFRILMNSDKSLKIDTEDKCCICLDTFHIKEETDNDYIVELNTNKSKSNHLHYKCFMNYLKIEQSKYNIDCKCPFKNLFNFKECYKLVSYE